MLVKKENFQKNRNFGIKSKLKQKMKSSVKNRNFGKKL